MAVYKHTNPTAIAGTLVFDPASDATDDSDGDNVTAASSGSVYLVQIDNSKNKSTAAYVKIIDASSATPGSSTPAFVFYAPAKKVVTYQLPAGHAYSAGVSFWCSTGAGRTNTTNPVSAVKVRILAS